MGQMLEKLQEYLENIPDEQLKKDYDELKKWNDVGPTVEEYVNLAEDTDKDICKDCGHMWIDFPMPLENAIAHCEIVDKKYGFKSMDDVVLFPCTKCPFNSFVDNRE